MYSNSIHDLALYIHIPFCAAKCIYCDFLSYAGRESHFDAYFDQLNKEIKENSKLYGRKPVRSVFIGGGTPSYAGAKRISSVIRNIFDNYNVQHDAEITVEMNPGTVSKSDFQNYKECGVNRISFGVQSLDNSLLKFLGRIHSGEDFINAYNWARDIGFDNINADLIFGIPGQSIKQFSDTLKEIMLLNLDHISAYSLIVEPDTKLDFMIDKGYVSEPSDADDREMYKLCCDMLKEEGYNHYEISNFSKADRECIHNIRYWVGGDYLGMGLGAASLINKKRFNNTSNFNEYIAGINTISNEVELTEKEFMDEYMMLGFRMINGPDKKGFVSRFGIDYETIYGDILEDLVRKGLIEKNSTGNFALTEKGFDFGNEVFREFV